MIGNIQSMDRVLAQQFRERVAPIWIDEMKAKIARDTAANFYAQAAKDIVQDSVYNKTGEAPTVEMKVGRILDIRA